MFSAVPHGTLKFDDDLPSHKWLGYFRMMPLLRSLGFFNFDFLQICCPDGLSLTARADARPTKFKMMSLLRSLIPLRCRFYK
jgi:hypothetical protein